MDLYDDKMILHTNRLNDEKRAFNTTKSIEEKIN